MKYSKPPLLYAEQLQLLANRGLMITDAVAAELYLHHISYYRLSAYMLPFQSVKDVFNTGTTFADIIDLYVFDRELRLLALDAIERIEVAVRSQIIYQMAHKYGAHWQDNATLFKPPAKYSYGTSPDYYNEVQQIIAEHCRGRNPEVFIDHYKNKYTSPPTPPSWMSIELLSIGQLSRLYKGLRMNADKKELADYFGLHYTVFESWLHTLTYCRNICAHHARLWNRDFAIQPELLMKPRLPWITPGYNNNKRSYYFLCILKYFLLTVNPQGHFHEKTEQLLQTHPNVPSRFMGFTKDWQNEPLWQQ